MSRQLHFPYIYGYNFRKRFVNNTAGDRNLVSNGVTLAAELFKKLWSSIVSCDKDLNATGATTEDAMYEEYRDELDDFVTIEDHI